MSQGIHTKPVRGASEHWITPPEIIHALGTFDLDPCHHPKQFYKTSRRVICLPSDGLSAKWRGRVWLNPPYGDKIGDWLRKLAKDHGQGTALVPARTEVEKWFWPFVWESADAVLFVRGRLHFLQPDGTKIRIVNGKKKKTGNAGHGSVLVAYGKADASILADAMTRGDIRGKYFRLR